MSIIYCKVEDKNGKEYILTDKFNQPLIMDLRSGMCVIQNIKKIIDNPVLFKKTNEPGFLLDNTNITSTVIKDGVYVYVSKPINISDIDFNIYDIATFNKDIVIKDKDDKQYTGKEIEQNLFFLFGLDKDNQDYINKMKQQYGEDPPIDIIVEFFKKNLVYYQKLLIKEEYNNCIISDWTPCKDNTQTRKRTESTKIGKACTPDQNNLPLTQTCSPPSSPSSTESSDNNMYIGIGILVFFLIAIAFGVYMFKQKNQNPYPYPYPNQQYMYR
jgi:hypothetical protein